MAADDSAILEAVRRGLITPEEAADMMEPPAEDSAMGFVKSAGMGIARGLGNLAGFPGQIQRGLNAAMGATPTPENQVPIPKEVRDYASKLYSSATGQEPFRPETPLQKDVAGGTEFATDFLPGSAKQLALALLAGGVGQMAVHGKTENPEAMKAAGELGTMAAGAATHPVRSAASLAARTLSPWHSNAWAVARFLQDINPLRHAGDKVSKLARALAASAMSQQQPE